MYKQLHAKGTISYLFDIKLCQPLLPSAQGRVLGHSNALKITPYGVWSNAALDREYMYLIKLKRGIILSSRKFQAYLKDGRIYKQEACETGSP